MRAKHPCPMAWTGFVGFQPENWSGIVRFDGLIFENIGLMMGFM